tara:strand:+ start:4169 stop:4534 length:366 start_codon:yes stop_codon:yes gene_type:complete
MINYGEVKLGYINYVGSLRYGPSGKKRKGYYKTKSLSAKSRSKETGKTIKPDPNRIAQQKESEKHRKMYPSLDIHSVGKVTGTKHDDSYKQEVSKNYTVAIGYNKGGYQVIPKSEIKDIGK